jgi:hypothetical protein
MMRAIVLGLGIFGMLLGAGLGLYAGHELRACVAEMKAAGLRSDTDAYNALVPECNARLQLRSLSFGVVVVGALLIAAPTGYDAIRRIASR